MNKIFLLAGTAILSVSAPALADHFVKHPRLPLPVIFESDGIGTANAWAKARVDRDSAVNYCQNYDPGTPLDECVDEVLRNEEDVVYEGSANCQTGEMTSIDGERYVYDGLWDNGGFWHGYSRFKDAETGEVIGDNNAEGGPNLTTNWNALCPYGAPYDRQPLKMVLDPEDPDDFSDNYVAMVMDDSLLNVDYEKGTITYSATSDEMSDLVPENGLLFRGAVVKGEGARGMAFSYAKGCDPVPYKVEGYHYNGGLELTGAAPVRNGCEVTGYSEDAPGAKLSLKPAFE